MKKVFYIMMFVFLVACGKPLTVEEQEYKDFCKETDGMWMKMSELHDGEPTGKTCNGCMPDEKNHLCTKEEYEAIL